LDAAIFAGTIKPASWPTALVPGAEAAGNVNTVNATVAEGGVIADLGELLDTVEADRFRSVRVRRQPHAARPDPQEPEHYRRVARRRNDLERLGPADRVQRPGRLPVGLPASLALAGDYSMPVVGIRQDMTF
jgi:hypothetical protein